MVEDILSYRGLALLSYTLDMHACMADHNSLNYIERNFKKHKSLELRIYPLVSKPLKFSTF